MSGKPAADAAHPSEETLRRRHRPARPREDDQPRVNDRIRATRVLVIDETGEKLGVMDTDHAQIMARDRKLDLVEVAPQAQPPVCRILDYGKLKYDRQKREAAARRSQKRQQVKELKVRPKTDDHDLEVKSRRAWSFLEDGHKVRIVVWFRGREHAHHDIGADQCMRIAEAVDDVGRIEQPPLMEGRNMTMMLAPDA